jgi:pimeloyl-ACP methyl ester carboxylesterase
MSTNAERRWSLPEQQVFRRVLRHDPGQEYFVYIPSSGGHDAPICVCVHGLSRNPLRKVRLLSDQAEAYGVVLVAPHFAARQHPDFQRLGRAGRGERADLVLQGIVEEASWLTGVSSAQVYLLGHSGGAQFVHRYVMAHPQRVARAAVCSPGWYTLPDRKRRFPYGIRMTNRLPGVRFDPEEFLGVPITVVVGAKDTSSQHVRHSARLDAQQGRTRVERARNWVAAMQQAARSYGIEPSLSLRIIPEAGHSFERAVVQHGLGEIVFEELFGPSRRRSQVRQRVPVLLSTGANPS